MPKAITHFEQVPIKTVMRIIDEELKREEAAELAAAAPKKLSDDTFGGVKAQ